MELHHLVQAVEMELSKQDNNAIMEQDLDADLTAESNLATHVVE